MISEICQKVASSDLRIDLKDELDKMKFNANKIFSENWGISNSFQKIWYQKTVEQIIIYKYID